MKHHTKQQQSLAARSPQPMKLTMIQGWFMNSVMVILWVGSVFSRFRISIFTTGRDRRHSSSEDGTAQGAGQVRGRDRSWTVW